MHYNINRMDLRARSARMRPDTCRIAGVRTTEKSAAEQFVAQSIV